MREYIVELMKYKEKSELIRDFQRWRLPPFPLNGNIVRQYGTVGKVHDNNSWSSFPAYAAWLGLSSIILGVLLAWPWYSQLDGYIF